MVMDVQSAQIREWEVGLEKPEHSVLHSVLEINLSEYDLHQRHPRWQGHRIQPSDDVHQSLQPRPILNGRTRITGTFAQGPILETMQ